MSDTTKKAMTLPPAPIPVCTYKAPDGVTDWPAYSFEQLQQYGYDAIDAHLSAQRKGEAVAEVVNLQACFPACAVVPAMPVGTKLYYSPSHPRVEVTDEMVERVAESLRQNGWASGGDYVEDFLPDVRAALEAALLEKASIRNKLENFILGNSEGVKDE
jgi:hypothetical protein